MIGYVTLGTNKLDAAAQFCDELLATIGAARATEGDTFKTWSRGPNSPVVSIKCPTDGNKATVGNGVMVAIAVDEFEKVHALFFRDLDGNKLDALHCRSQK